MNLLRHSFCMLLLLPWATAAAQAGPCNAGTVYEDRNGNSRRDPGEPGIAGIKLSDGERLVVTDADGHYRLPIIDGRSVFLVKPPGYATGRRANGMPDYWRNVRTGPGPSLQYAGIPVAPVECRDFALRRETAPDTGRLRALVFSDPQVKSMVDVGYYGRDIVDSAAQSLPADLGLTLGDVVHDDLSLYPALTAHTARLDVPWLHAPGNHDLDFDAPGDAASLLSFRHYFGPDSFAWEEPQATFVVLDDVVYRPGQSPVYIGGLRESQFAFLEAYLPTVSRDRLLVVAVHIPLFEEPGRDSFRDADRERLFALLDDFPRVLLLSGHSHTQRHVFHGAGTGWHGAQPLHEYNVGAASGAFWSGVENAAGVPDTTMADGTPNGHGLLTVDSEGRYRLEWIPAGPAGAEAGSTGAAPAPAFTRAMALHAPQVLRRGSWPSAGVYANVFMGMDDTRVEYRIDDGEWWPMRKVAEPDPRLVRQNVLDDAASALRGYDRAPQAAPSPHLWRGVLPTDLETGGHRIEVRAFDRWQGEQRAASEYRLVEAEP